MEQYEKIAIAQRDKINISIVVHECGRRVCEAGQREPLQWSDAFSLYYVSGGKGWLTLGDRHLSVGPNASFLVHSQSPVIAQADEHEPWTLVWVVFSGYLVRDYMERAGFSYETPIFEYPDDPCYERLFMEMFQHAHHWHNRYCKILSCLYSLIAKHIDLTAMNYQIKEKYGNDFTMRRALEYIDQHYAQADMRIEDIAQYVSLSRTRFHHVFRKMMQISPQQYLIQFRMRRAADLLKMHGTSVTELARLVGYSDPFHFSKTFKQVYGASPTHYAQSMAATPEALQDYRIQLGIMQAHILELEAENRALIAATNGEKND